MLRSLIMTLSIYLISVPARADEPDLTGRFDLEVGVFPVFTERQIEGPERDDRVVSDPMLATFVSSTYRVLDWLAAGLAVHVDVGNTSRTRFDDAGTVEIEGTYWETWVVLLARAWYGVGFFELGWAPLVLRDDTARTDLPNESGDVDGVFLGSRSVAFLAGVGARVPFDDHWSLSVRLQLRIRYLIERGGRPLANEQEFGQMTAWPFVGLAYTF